MGGILLFGTEDLLQLLPIDRRPPMLSPHMISSFKFLRLHHSVRATLDLPFQQLQKITRMLPSEQTPEMK